MLGYRVTDAMVFTNGKRHYRQMHITHVFTWQLGSGHELQRYRDGERGVILHLGGPGDPPSTVA